MKTEVIALAGWPPEVLAYAYAMYSRSSLSIRESILKITNEKASGFLDTFYFGYGHKSIADNAHIPLALENVSEIVAFQLEDEQLWDGQERSTRYQNFDKSGAYFIPEAVRNTPHERSYCLVADFLLEKYRHYGTICFEYLAKKNPKPADMKEADYERTLKARAFDVARYWLFNGILTSVGQITSARTLEDQISRLMSAEYRETVSVAEQMKQACQAKPFCPEGKDEPPVAPTLVKYTSPKEYLIRVRELMRKTVSQYKYAGDQKRHAQLIRPFRSIKHEILAGLIFEASQWSMQTVQELVNILDAREIDKILGEVHGLRGPHDSLPKAFAAGYGLQFDVCMDIGGRRDLHRHRNCIQLHQDFTVERGFDTPFLVKEMGKMDHFETNMAYATSKIRKLKDAIGNDADYLIPFAFRAGTLYKMDYRQAEYITVLRSTPQGHFSYREIVVEMDRQVDELVPGFKQYSRVTPFDNENIFKR